MLYCSTQYSFSWFVAVIVVVGGDVIFFFKIMFRRYFDYSKTPRIRARLGLNKVDLNSKMVSL